jgi:hypothetical protein
MEAMAAAIPSLHFCVTDFRVMVSDYTRETVCLAIRITVNACPPDV